MSRALFAGLLLLAGPALAADDLLLSRFVGDWIGNGTFRASATAAPERVYCKIANTLIEGGTTLQQKGRCAIASNTGPVDGTIAALGGDRYGGTLDSLASAGPATISGVGSGDRLILEADYVDARSNKPVTSRTTLAVTEGGYTLRSEQTDPQSGTTFVSTEIDFAAK